MKLLIKIAWALLIIQIPDIALSSNNEIAAQTSVKLEALASVPKISTPVRIAIHSTNNEHTGKVYLTSALGKVAPTYVELVNGKWAGDVTFFESGKNNHLILWWDNQDTARQGNSISTAFDVIDSGGNINSDATLIGEITRIGQLPVDGATVQLFDGDPKQSGEKVYTAVTNRSGDYTFENIQPGVYYQTIEKEGYRSTTQEVLLASKRIITSDRKLYSNSCDPHGLTPVLLVPGIMGSHGTAYSRTIVYPELPVISPKWDSGGLSLFNPGGELADPIGWNGLKSALEQYGYQEGCTIFDVPYDWSLSVPDARDQYLIPWINYIKQISGSDKVDIIAHSMGGLVARSYIQSDQYVGDVRKFAVVGTPNKGADLAYYLWEGGDPLIADYTTPNTYLSEFFYSNTLDYFYSDRYSGDICEYCHPIDWYYPCSCDNEKIYKLLHSQITSTGQLMPTYDDALVATNRTINVPIKIEENALIKALSSNSTCFNPRGCIDPHGNVYNFTQPQYRFARDNTTGPGIVQTKLFIGANNPTVKSIYVNPQPGGYTGDLYKDGNTSIFFRGDGDGTVLKQSVFFDEYFPERLDFEETTSNHASDVKSFTADVVAFITGANRASVKKETPQRILAINIGGRVQPDVISVVDPNGNPIKLTDLSGKENFKINSSNVVIENPVDGEYSVLLNSPYKENYELSISYYNSNNKLFAQRYNGYFDNSLKTFSFVLNTDSFANPVIFDQDRLFSIPVDLKVSDSDGKIQLVWQDTVGDTNRDVDCYEVYWKSDADPHMRLLVQTNQKKYLTSHDWKNAKSNVYAVRAKLKNGKSTFLSPKAFFIPTKFQHGL